MTMPFLSKWICVYLSIVIGLAERKKESSKWKQNTVVNREISKLTFFHQEFSNYFLKGKNGLQICYITCLISKSQLIILNHFMSRQWKQVKSWASLLFFPPCFILLWEGFMHIYEILCVHSGLHIPYSIPIPPSSVSPWPLRPQGCTHQCHRMFWGHVQGIGSQSIIGEKFLNSCYLDLSLEGEGLCFHVGISFRIMESSLPHEEGSAGEGSEWCLLNVKRRAGQCTMEQSEWQGEE